eukprot:TRINITY_DN13673_c0_g1_i4.p2 TRINITY_DN13673_c0_g1~~TRINITY_DN13673_c0_g1_i4.p2  ORF type:complete len:221 (+),score=-19.18 TRINITY_DN13673_c0_g1_i4:1772-2434(+)
MVYSWCILSSSIFVNQLNIHEANDCIKMEHLQKQNIIYLLQYQKSLFEYSLYGTKIIVTLLETYTMQKNWIKNNDTSLMVTIKLKQKNYTSITYQLDYHCDFYFDVCRFFYQKILIFYQNLYGSVDNKPSYEDGAIQYRIQRLWMGNKTKVCFKSKIQMIKKNLKLIHKIFDWLMPINFIKMLHLLKTFNKLFTLQQQVTTLNNFKHINLTFGGIQEIIC